MSKRTSSSQAEAPDLEDLYVELGGDGLVVISALGENVDSETPTSDDLSSWANAYDLTFPVVADPGFDGLYSFATTGTVGLPYRVLIDRDMVIVDASGGASDADVRDLVGG